MNKKCKFIDFKKYFGRNRSFNKDETKNNAEKTAFNILEKNKGIMLFCSK